VPVKITITLAMFTLNCKGKITVFESPCVMGIINITPDSFYTGYLPESVDVILAIADKMIKDGAAILDIGGQSTRPGSIRIGAQEEWDRIAPVIDSIRAKYPGVLLSVDTYHSKVAEWSVQAGADIINDISAGEMDLHMIGTVASLKVPYICMHMKGMPETMQSNTGYHDIAKELIDYFSAKLDTCQRSGIHDIIIDPGFGFGKSITDNFQLLNDLHIFRMLGKPLLAGLSRKSTVYKTLGITAAEALNGSTVLHTIALQQGADILRVHDVKEAMEAITLVEAYKKIAPGRSDL
jgi:dihydropteroate synthase